LDIRGPVLVLLDLPGDVFLIAILYVPPPSGMPVRRLLLLDTTGTKVGSFTKSGVVSVFDEQNLTLVPKASSKLADDAHTVAVDQATHRVYFPLQDVDGHPVLRVMEPSK